MNEFSVDDAALVKACRAGDAMAWRSLVDRYSRLLYAIGRRCGLDEAGAEDVMQSTLTTLVQHLDRLAEPDRLRAWLVTTAKREAWAKAAEARKHATDAADDDALDAVAADATQPDEALAALEELQAVWAALATIGDRCQQLLTHLYGSASEPASYSKIAHALGIPEGSIGPTRARCLAKLRAAMDVDSGADK